MENEVVVLDFETTGLSSDYDRIIEVGAAIVKGEEVIDTFSALCDPGVFIPSFITSLTGITNSMVAGMPAPEEVMTDFCDFLGDRPVLAHNASFDSRFLRAEMARIDVSVENPFLCTMLLARRLIHDTMDHKLGTLKHYINFKEKDGHKDHRALDDVEITVSLWLYMKNLVEKTVGNAALDFTFYQKLSRMAKHKAKLFLQGHGAAV